jgi:hypothetical protein
MLRQRTTSDDDGRALGTGARSREQALLCMTATSRAKYRTIGRRQWRCAVRRGRGDPRWGSRHQEAAQQRPTTMGDEQQTCASWKKIRRGDAGNTPWLNPEHAGEQGFVRATLNPSREAGAGKLRRSWGARWPWLGALGELRQVAASSEEQTRGGRGSRAQLDTGLGDEAATLGRRPS